MRLIPLFLILAGCASEPYLMPETDDLSRASGYAWTGAGMYTRKPQPDRRDPKPWEFYYKHCSAAGDDSPFAGKSFECSGPSY